MSSGAGSSTSTYFCSDFVDSLIDGRLFEQVKALQVYQEVGYKYMLMPDHVPHISGRDPSGTAFAFCYGYITALLQAAGEPRRQGWIFKK